ncbi:DUF3180 domain-containing protein [Mycolicibacterium sp. CH28]|uniref:DUF3180 domain-containing protein n=1 Tax=Mycolicibacterium sp. CH28 TaxID=2512237 RepID=UPI00107FF19F|nr:DUF3180 domain-containing protein [Mycolicibacterium sp. CH28]TGD83929.1 DUF3180 domain-containing protein [Mycolicibacterium sp. CH28]
MGPTRIRDLTVVVVGVAVLAWLLMRVLYHYFPPITLWTGLSLLVVGALEAAWAVSVRAKIRSGQIGVGGGRLHPLAVARSVVIAKASAWLGALMLGWWGGVLVFLLLRRAERVASAYIPGVVVAAVSALALVAGALWLEHCCKSPGEPTESADAAPE